MHIPPCKKLKRQTSAILEYLYLVLSLVTLSREDDISRDAYIHAAGIPAAERILRVPTNSER